MRLRRSALVRRLVVLALAAASLAAVVPSRAAGEPVTRWGYMTTSDGARLRWTAVLPSATGRFPVALIWSVYTDGTGPTGEYPPAESPVIAEALLDAGYAIVGMAMRGTGCSGGQWDLFQPADDGSEAVEWAARQSWADGTVGMFGFSAPGISQILTAGTRPPSLRAITPADVSTDFYRDVAYPGGIPNAVFAPAWMLGARPGHEALSAGFAAGQGDAECGIEIASRPQPNTGADFLEAAQHPYFDKVWERYNPERFVRAIDVPVLTCQATQDDQVTSRAAGWWLDDLDPARTWAVFTNGSHGTCDDYRTPFTDQVVRFFDRYVKGIDNGFERDEPHVQIWHDTVHDEDAAANVPSWITTHPSWPVAVAPRVWHLGDGALADDAPATQSAAAYVAPLPAPSMDANEYTGFSAAWTVPGTPGGSVAWTSQPLGEDIEVFGPGSADLWLSSTAPDTDLQVTVTEVRDDGSEEYVQRGWLRASHRALDAARSTALRPRHTHRRQDAAPLPAAEPVPLRVEINALSHVFRAGSRVRLTVESPVSLTGLFGSAASPVPAVNRILAGGAFPSRLVLGRVADGSAAMPAVTCGAAISRPCRPAVV